MSPIVNMCILLPQYTHTHTHMHARRHTQLHRKKEIHMLSCLDFWMQPGGSVAPRVWCELQDVSTSVTFLSLSKQDADSPRFLPVLWKVAAWLRKRLPK